MFNMQQMMQKAQAMQKKMEILQQQLNEVEVQGAAGGGLVSVTATCKGYIRTIAIDPSLMKAEEKEILEGLIKAACNDARSKADKKMADETEKAMAEMGLPKGMLGSGGLPF